MHNAYIDFIILISTWTEMICFDATYRELQWASVLDWNMVGVNAELLLAVGCSLCARCTENGAVCILLTDVNAVTEHFNNMFKEEQSVRQRIGLCVAVNLTAAINKKIKIIFLELCLSKLLSSLAKYSYGHSFRYLNVEDLLMYLSDVKKRNL